MHVVIVIDHAHVNGGQAKVAIDSALGLRARRAAPAPKYMVLPVGGIPWKDADRDQQKTQASPRHAEVGRNDPCPCGSGKKYKKCCLQ